MYPYVQDQRANEAERRKQRAAIAAEAAKWQSGVQDLTRATQPSARLLDYLQEDLDSMRKELDRWRAENEQLAQKMRREQKYATVAVAVAVVLFLCSRCVKSTP